MKTKILFIVLLLGICSLLWPNPVDNTPITKFSELVFDSNNNWTMEILFPFGYWTDATDSIIIKVSDTKAKLITTYKEYTQIGIITRDSLSIPLTINRDGDTITLYTYSSLNGIQVRVDELIFGNSPGASVGQPVAGYSIVRNTLQVSLNYLTIDCLTKNTSLGVVNDTTGLSILMKGNIYDIDNNPVTKLKTFPVSPCYFEMDTPLIINGDGTYTTKIFRRFAIDMKDHLTVRLVDFDSWRDTVYVEPFELNDIHPGTTIVQDIHLKNNDYVVTDVKNPELTQTTKLELINFPNPFNASTNFFVKIPEQMQGKAGDISIYNTNGQLVKRIPLKQRVRYSWDGTGKNGSLMPSGVYYYRLNIDRQIMKSGSMILLK